MRFCLFFKILLWLVTSVILASCARSPIKDPQKALRETKKPLQALKDDMNYDRFFEALNNNIVALEKSKNEQMIFGPRSIKTCQYVVALKSLQQFAQQKVSTDALQRYLHENFIFNEVYGQKKWSDVFITGYYEPVIKGALRATAKYSYPLIEPPQDLVMVRMNDFTFRKELNPPLPTIAGRVVENKNKKEVVPYYSREEIYLNQDDIIKKTKVLAWVDPVDAFFLQIQGSGRVQIVDAKEKPIKEIRLGYAGQNGHPYSAIGQYLFDVIPRDKMSQIKIENHLRSLSPEERYKILFLNPSYVFFTEVKNLSPTIMGVSATAGRTIATDGQFFPKGALAFLNFNKPIYTKEALEARQDESIQFETVGRFVFDQDIGGAIRGPGRVDLFWGSGVEGQLHSGVMRHRGHLFYLFPKDIDKLKCDI